MTKTIINNDFWIICSLIFSAIILQSAYTRNDENHPIEIVGESPMLGEITLFAGNFPPRGWAFCEGQELQTSSYPALHSILKATYGGDGTSTFALPDLRNRVPIGAGTDHNGKVFTLGDKLGSATIIAPTATVMRSTSDGFYALEEIAQKSNDQPYLKIGYIISLNGLYPQRN